MTQEEIDYYINDDTLSILIGKRISELANTSKALSDTYFMFSRKESDGTYSQKKISYYNLIKQMSNDISGYLHLSSMAFHEYWEYSKVNHTHDYNCVICKPTYQLSDFSDKNQISCICEVLTSNQDEQGVVSILYPPYEQSKPVVPDIGEFRLYAAKNTKTSTQIRNDIENGTFDGWVYTDGGQYSKTQGQYDFTEAFKHYGGTGTTFNVPKFEDFLRLNGVPNEIDKNGYDWVHYHNKLISHKHTLSPKGSDLVGKKVEVKITIGGGTDVPDKPNGLHLMYQEYRKNILTAITANIDIDDAKATGRMKSLKDSYGGEDFDIETKPKHYILPGMVYIGAVKK